jgi:hypothetical protein
MNRTSVPNFTETHSLVSDVKHVDRQLGIFYIHQFCGRNEKGKNWQIGAI